MLMDALVSLFIAATAIVALFSFVAFLLRFTAKTYERTDAILAERNGRAERMLDFGKQP